MKDIATTEQPKLPEVTPAAPMSTEQQAASLITVIEKLAANPDVNVDSIKQMLDMQERIMNKQAEMEFNSSMAELQPQLPMIQRSAKGHNTMYARYEDIERMVRPLYTKYGFSLTYTSELLASGKEETYTGRLLHKSGHYRDAQITLPADTSGSKNPIQAKGSSMSYAKRYLITMLLNIVTCGEDDDGQYFNSELIDIETAKRIHDRINKLPNKQQYFNEFIEYLGVENLREIPKSKLQEALTALSAKEREANENS